MKKTPARRVPMILLGTLVIVMFIGMAGRIWWVNERLYPYPYPEEHHSMGEWVELNGAFIDSRSENTDGYAIKVTDADMVSYREYLDLYGPEDADIPDDPELNAKSILCLTLELRNDSKTSGGAVLLGEFALIPDGMPLVYNYDPMLWSESNPNINQMSFLIAALPGTSTVQHIPYGAGDLDATGGISRRYYSDLATAESYELVISNAPVRHVIDIEIDE